MTSHDITLIALKSSSASLLILSGSHEMNMSSISIADGHASFMIVATCDHQGTVYWIIPNLCNTYIKVLSDQRDPLNHLLTPFQHVNTLEEVLYKYIHRNFNCYLGEKVASDVKGITFLALLFYRCVAKIWKSSVQLYLWSLVLQVTCFSYDHMIPSDQ